jgi:hypothetical protein
VRGRNATLAVAIAALGLGVFAGGLAAGGLFEREASPRPARPATDAPRQVSLPEMAPAKEDPNPVVVAGPTITGDLAARRGERARRAAKRRAARRRAARARPDRREARGRSPR